MNLADMIKQVNWDIDDSIETSYIKEWINRGIDDISPIARIKARKTTTITQVNTYEIPADCREIQYVIVDGDVYEQIAISDTSNTGYKVWGKEIIVQNGPKSGGLELYYFRNLARLVNDTDEPEIESEFHDLFILYAVAMSQYSDDEMQRQSDAFSRYMARKQEYQRFVSRKESIPHAITDVYGVITDA